MRFADFAHLMLCTSAVLVWGISAEAGQPGCGPEAGDCCAENRSPGCNVEECCAEVCACDPYCCEVAWDRACATDGQNGDGCGAAVLCNVCMDSDGDGVPDDTDICCDTPGGVSVDERGRPLGDLDRDCDVDLDDFAMFQRNLRGVTEAAGVCCVQTPAVCNDGDNCTVDFCDDVIGCINTPVVCPQGEYCDPATGACVPVGCLTDADCDDASPCTTDRCIDSACVNTPVQCGQGERCNPATGNCEDIECTSNADCDDGFSCTLDRCNLSTNECGYTPVDEDCIDGLYCNGAEFCDPANPRAEEGTGCVIPGNPCGGGTPVCDEANNECDPCTSDGQCDDGFDCTLDTCEGGPCLNNPRDSECDDGLYCTATDECLPEDDDADERGCVNRDTPCDCALVACGAGAVAGDYLLCSETENDGTGGCVPCVGEGDCDDGVPCTLDVCNAAHPRYCSNTPSDAACPDPVFCDGTDACDPDNRDADFNGCVPPGVPACDNPLPICDEANEECLICESNAECNEWEGVDDDLCTLTKCNVVGVGECSNEPVDCDDADACTWDWCNAATGACDNDPYPCIVVGDCPIGCNTTCTSGFCTR